MSDPTGDGSVVSPERVSWTVDTERRVLTIACRGGVSDDDLLTAIPRLWEKHPEVIGCDTLVDARALTSKGGCFGDPETALVWIGRRK